MPFGFNFREGSQQQPVSQERLEDAVQRPIDVLSNPNATAGDINGLDSTHLQMLQSNYGRVHGRFQEQLRTMRRTMDLHIQVVQNATDDVISPQRRKELIGQLNGLRSELGGSIMRPGEFVQTQYENVSEFARNNPNAVNTVVAVGAVALVGTLITSLWTAATHSGPNQETAGEAWSTFWKGMLLTTVGTAAVGVAAYFGWPRAQELYAKYLKQQEQLQITAKEDQAIQKAQGVTDGAVKALQSAVKQFQLANVSTHEPLRKAVDATRTSRDAEETLTRSASFMAEVGNARSKQMTDRWTGIRKQIADAQALLPAPPPAPAPQSDVKAGDQKRKLDNDGNRIPEQTKADVGEDQILNDRRKKLAAPLKLAVDQRTIETVNNAYAVIQAEIKFIQDLPANPAQADMRDARIEELTSLAGSMERVRQLLTKQGGQLPPELENIYDKYLVANLEEKYSRETDKLIAAALTPAAVQIALKRIENELKIIGSVVGVPAPNLKIRADQLIKARERLQKPGNQPPQLDPVQTERKRILDQIPSTNLLGQTIEIARDLRVKVDGNPLVVTVNGVRWRAALETVYNDYESVNSVGSAWRNTGSFFGNRGRQAVGAAGRFAVDRVQVTDIRWTGSGFRMFGSVLGLSIPRPGWEDATVSLDEIVTRARRIADASGNTIQASQLLDDREMNEIPLPSSQRFVLQRVR